MGVCAEERDGMHLCGESVFACEKRWGKLRANRSACVCAATYGLWVYVQVEVEKRDWVHLTKCVCSVECVLFSYPGRPLSRSSFW